MPKLALYEPPYGQGRQKFERQRQRVNELIRTGQPGQAAEFFLVDIGTPPEAVKGLKSSPQWDGVKQIEFTLAYDYQILGNDAVPKDVAKAVKVPTLVMTGEKSFDFMRPTADRIARLIAGSHRKTLKGQMHQAQAGAVAPVLIEFFNGPPGR